MALSDAEIAAVAAKVWAYRFAEKGLLGMTPLEMLNQAAIAAGKTALTAADSDLLWVGTKTFDNETMKGAVQDARSYAHSAAAGVAALAAQMGAITPQQISAVVVPALLAALPKGTTASGTGDDGEFSADQMTGLHNVVHAELAKLGMSLTT